jgi:hypothetical protein
MLPTLSFSAKDFSWFDRDDNPIVNDWILAGKSYPLEKQEQFRAILEEEQKMVFDSELHDPAELVFLYSQEELSKLHKDIGMYIIMNAIHPYVRNELLEQTNTNYAQQTFHNKKHVMEEILQHNRKPFEKALIKRLDAYTNIPTDIHIRIAKYARLPPFE